MHKDYHKITISNRHIVVVIIELIGTNNSGIVAPMTENPGKSAFGEFELETGSLAARDVMGGSQAEPTEEQMRAATALRVWDAMAQGAYPPNTVRAWRADWRAFTQFCLVK